MRHSFLLMVVFLGLISCKKKADGDASWSCTTPDTDSALISVKIVGSWQFTRYSCPTQTLTLTDKNIELIFNSDATYSLLENSAVIVQGTWRLQVLLATSGSLRLLNPQPTYKVQSCSAITRLPSLTVM